MRQTLVEVDGIRLYVRHSTASQLELDVIRQLLMGRERTHIIVVALSLRAAIRKYFREEGAKLGARGTRESAALWIDLEEPILAFPPCPHMRSRRNSRGEFLCGGKGPDGWPSILDGYGGCNHDKEWDCPISRFMGLCWPNGVPRREVTIDGVVYRVIHHEDVL